jgi:sulfide:quinone oxidoreductase
MTFPINQAKPNWAMWMLKTKVLPWLYWNKILKELHSSLLFIKP